MKTKQNKNRSQLLEGMKEQSRHVGSRVQDPGRRRAW